MKLFSRLFNTSILKSVIIHKNNTGKGIDQLLFRFYLLELFLMYPNATECKVSCQYSSGDKVPHRKQRYFTCKFPPTANINHRDGLLFVRCVRWGKILCTGVRHVTLGFMWNVFDSHTKLIYKITWYYYP